MTARQRLEQIRGRLDALLAGGLKHAPAGEMADVAACLESLQLSHPAEVLKALAVAAADRALERRHFDDFIQVLAMLNQVAARMIALQKVEADALEPVGTHQGLFVEGDLVRPLLDEPLEKILQVSNRYVSSCLLSRYAARMTLEDLEARMTVLWSDARVMPLIVHRLQDEPEEGLRLARRAVGLGMRLVQRTAVRVLEALNSPPGTDLLEELVRGPEPVVAHEARAALSRLGDNPGAFRQVCDASLRAHEHTLEVLATGKDKHARAAAAATLRDTRSPVFVGPLRLALADTASTVRGAALEALGFVGDLQLVEEITEETFQVDALARGAATGLAELGDVRGLELLWRLYVAHKRPNLVPEALRRMPHLLTERLAASLGDRKLIGRSTTAQFIECAVPAVFARLVRAGHDRAPDPKRLESAVKLASRRADLADALAAAWTEEAPEPIEKLRASLRASQVEKGRRGFLGRLWRGKS